MCQIYKIIRKNTILLSVTFNRIVMGYTDMLNQTETITIENVTFSIVQVKDIVDRLPENSWLAEKSDEFADHTIFFHEGDIELSILRLGELPEWSLGYFIIGNVTVGRIIEASDDSAMGLVVDGDLTVDHIRAGGNDIYVSGDLQVNGLFFGKYSHGSITVDGEHHANAFIADDYADWIDNVWALSDDECFDDEEISEEEYEGATAKILEAIRPEFIIDLDDVDEPFLWSHLLDYHALEKAMKYNAPIFQDEFLAENNVEFINAPVVYKTVELPQNFVIDLHANIQSALATDAVETLAETMTGLAHNHAFIPQVLHNEDNGISVSFSEAYPDRFFIETISVRSNHKDELPHGLRIGMTSAELKAQFGDSYSETTFEDYPDSLQGNIALADMAIELLLEDNVVTYINYQVLED